MGSLMVGPAAFIHKAHKIRKQLGGGMRQVSRCAHGAVHTHAIQETTVNRFVFICAVNRLVLMLKKSNMSCPYMCLQVAVLAAPGLVALRDTPPKLAVDHANAKLIAAGAYSHSCCPNS